MKTILITGASGGLGRVLCGSFSKMPTRLGLHVFRQEDKGEKLVRRFQSSHCDTHLFSADLRDADAVREMFRHFKSRWGAIDLLINNAGVNHNSLFQTENPGAWEDLIQVNLSGVFFTMREAAKLMKKQGEGHIINIASGAAFAGRSGQAAYAASKRGLIGLSRSAAKEWGASGIQVNAVCPGYLPTAMTAGLTSAQSKKLIAENVLTRPSTLEEVSTFICTLSSMKHVSGQIFHLDSRII